MKPLVGILMGSDSDWPTMKAAADVLQELGVSCEVNVMSAHRTPDDVAEYSKTAVARGLQVLIAGAGGAAHLAGVVAAVTPLPVIAVPIETKCAGGLDSLLAMVQMPSGVPVACVAIGGAKNAGILAAQIISTADAPLQERVVKFKAKIANEARAKNRKLRESMAAGK
jgi:5-(carboxyamino)imidazole ribonucleotide mutase